MVYFVVMFLAFMLVFLMDLNIMQPPLMNALGVVSNVSSAIMPTAERPDRLIPAVSMGSLVSQY